MKITAKGAITGFVIWLVLSLAMEKYEEWKFERDMKKMFRIMNEINNL